MNVMNQPELFLLLAAGSVFLYGIIPHLRPGQIERLFASDNVLVMLYLVTVIVSPALFVLPVMGLLHMLDVPFGESISLLAGYWMYLTQRMNTRPTEKKSAMKD